MSCTHLIEQIVDPSWVGSIGKLSNIPFLDNQDVFFLQNILEHDLCILC